MRSITITLEEQKTILDLINHVRITVNPNYDFFKKQREDLTMRLNNSIIDSRTNPAQTI